MKNWDPETGQKIYLMAWTRKVLRQRTIGVRTCICHAESVWFIVFEVGKFVLELFAPDAFPTRPVSKRITTLEQSAFKYLAASMFADLNHKFSDHAMENSVVIISIPCMGDKILHRLGSHFGK